MSSTAARFLRGSQGVERAARAGLYGKGFLYVVLGLLAGQVALQGGGDEASQSGAIDAVAEGPFGTMLLGVLVLGLAAYALWRLAQVVIGPVGTSSVPDPILRLSFLLRALFYGALAFLGAKTLVGSGGSSGGSDQEQELTARVLGLPFGVPLVVAVGVVIGAVGLYQFKTALSRDFMDAVRPGAMSVDERRWFERAGVAGHLARGVTYLLVGGFLVRAALQFDPEEGVGLGAALSELAKAPHGTVMLLVVAGGLVLYGGYCLVLGRYARVAEVS
ncbi:MAG: DUF1206 domain-containing protein [Actinobacteria bacterium]|nr:DUF1206 domain-containing protein [Actinomycetota bacterium]